MYATLSYDIITGARPVEDVRKALVTVFEGCETCDLLADTFIARMANTKDFLARTQALKQVASDFTDQFMFVFTLHHSGAALRSNAPVLAKKIDSIIKD